MESASRYWVQGTLVFSLFFVVLVLAGCKEEEQFTFPVVRIAKFPNDKQAALSITFDDGCSSVFTKIVPMLDQHQWKGSFYIISETAEKKNSWDKWKDLRKQGHEVGNHSLTHSYYLGAIYDEQVLEKEIDSSFTLMKARMGEGPFAFSHPFHSTSPLADNIVFKNHFASRISPAGFCKLISLSDLVSFQADMDDAINTYKWIVTTAHGIDDCFNPMTVEFFDSFLKAVDEKKDSLHIDTFENLSKYKIESEYTKVTISKVGNDFLVRTENNLPGQTFNYPLTFLISNINTENYNIQTLEAQPISTIKKTNATQLQMAPGTSFLLRLKK